MLNRKQKNKPSVLSALFVFFLFALFSLSFFIMAFIIRIFALFIFYGHGQSVILEILLLIFFLVFFVLPFLPMYLLNNFMYVRFYNFFPSLRKYERYARAALYLISYALWIVIFQKIIILFDRFFADKISGLVGVITVAVIFLLDYVCERIYKFFKNVKT